MEKTMLTMQFIGFIAFVLEILAILLGGLLHCRTIHCLLVLCISALTCAIHVPTLFMQQFLSKNTVITLTLMIISFIVIVVDFFIIKAYNKRDEEAET